MIILIMSSHQNNKIISSDFKEKRKKEEQSYAKNKILNKYQFQEILSQNNNCAYCTKSEIDLSISFSFNSLCNNCIANGIWYF